MGVSAIVFFFFINPFKMRAPRFTATCGCAHAWLPLDEARGYYQPSAGEHACAPRPFYASAHLAHALVRGRRGTKSRAPCCVQTAACCLAARPALRAASACARAGRRVIEPKCPRAVPPRRSRTPAGTLLTDAGPLAYASLAARELSADGEWNARNDEQTPCCLPSTKAIRVTAPRGQRRRNELHFTSGGEGFDVEGAAEGMTVSACSSSSSGKSWVASPSSSIGIDAHDCIT